MKLKTQSSDKIEIYNWQLRIDQLYKLMQHDLSAANVAIIKKYDMAMVNEGLKKPTRFLHLNRILSLSRRIKTDWDKATKDDINQALFEIMDLYSDDGKDTEYTYDHKKVLKIFFRWLKFGNRSYKYCLKKFKAGDPAETEDIVMKRPQCKLKGVDLITDDERDWILDACESSRDRAMIDVPLDGGIRPGELLSLRVGDIKQDTYGFVAYVTGKTGVRTVRLIQSTPSLARWLSEHPFKENALAPLWINFDPKLYGQPLAYSAARMIIRRICKKVQAKHPQFQKRVFLNLFRHTEATKAAKYMSDGITKKRHGWSNDSRMPGRYGHLQNSDVEDTIFREYGIINTKDRPKVPITCPICSTINQANAKFCSKCAKPMSMEAAEEVTQQANEKTKNLEVAVEELKLKFDRHQIAKDEYQKKMENRIKDLEDKLKPDRKNSGNY